MVSFAKAFLYKKWNFKKLMKLNLENKNALVCGGTDGIGWATAQKLAEEGLNVTLFARNESKLKERVNALTKATPQKHSYLVADFSELKNVEKALSKASKEFHILINNTGGPSGGPIIEEDTSKFANTFEQHLMVNHYLSQQLVPFMKAEGFGRIINIISVSVKQPIIGLGVSNTIRWAVASWAKTLSKELSHTGITVNNVLPGFTKTSRLDQVNQMRAESERKTLAQVEEELQKLVPSGRFAEPGEVAAAVTFLASSIAHSINGVNLPVDGGFAASL